VYRQFNKKILYKDRTLCANRQEPSLENSLDKSNLREWLTRYQCFIRPKVPFAPEFSFNSDHYLLADDSWFDLLIVIQFNLGPMCHLLMDITCFLLMLFFLSRPNCFQIVIQHFSEEQYIFYFAGETPEQAQVRITSTYILLLKCLGLGRLF